jgi:two-component system sensor histidine kinase CiaH
MFKSTRIKVTVLIVILSMLISLLFSSLIYGRIVRVTRQDLMNMPKNLQQEHRQKINNNFSRVRENTLQSLIFGNVAIFITTAGIGYIVSGNIIKPIEQNIKNQKKFIANAAHELKTPITVMKTQLQVNLKDPKVKNKALLSSLTEETTKIANLINSLLTLNKVENNKLTRTQINLKDTVLEVVKSMNFAIKQKELTIDTNLNDLTILGYQNEIRELVTILLDNAIKFSHLKGKIEIKTNQNELVIKDYGSGMTKTQIERAFDRFYKANESRSNEGFGLGLSIAKEIANNHSAKININSELGQGTEVRVIFKKSSSDHTIL